MREIFFAKRARKLGSFLCPHPGGRDSTDCCLSRQEKSRRGGEKNFRMARG
ncbi:MAG: hypothetical protein LBC07_01715 [Elusimicrobiota bacterium]|nr:hypothetical protein [Elusimicrobiota bacterium]